MASQAVIDAVTTAVTNAFPLLNVRMIENEEDPEPPRELSAALEGFFALEFPPTLEVLRSLGDPGNNFWTENGAFIVHTIVPQGIGTVLANERNETIKTLFRSQQIGANNEITILDLFQTEDGNDFRGNWFVISQGFSFERDLIG